MIARHIILATSLVAATLATAGTASADEASRRARLLEIDRQQARETEQGRYNGELTRREYRELNAEAARINELERRAASDGYISRREFKEIREASMDRVDRGPDETGRLRSGVLAQKPCKKSLHSCEAPLDGA